MITRKEIAEAVIFLLSFVVHCIKSSRLEVSNAFETKKTYARNLAESYTEYQTCAQMHAISYCCRT